MRFIDTIEHGSNEESLPAEALSINGAYIEDEIPGYQTLTVSGRESYDMQYSEYRIGNTLHMQDYYQDSRVIEVEYQLQASTPEELMQRYNVLNGLLNFKEAKISFADESDKYYIGSKTASEAPPKGRLNITSTFQIYCPDPHKYSVATKQFTAIKNVDGILELTIDNEGTADVPIDYTIKHNHDNGYLGFVSDRGVLQTGKIQEVDGHDYQQAEILIQTNQFTEFLRDTSTNPENPAKATDGELAVMQIDGVSGLTLKTPSVSTGWGGGMVTATVPDDSEGNKPVNWWCYFNVYFESHNPNQIGCMSINFLDENDQIIYSYIIEKNSATNKAMVALRAGKDVQYMLDFTPGIRDQDNMFTRGQGHCDIIKNGANLSGYFFGVRKSVTVPELADVACHKIQMYIARYGTSPALTRSYFKSITFRNNVVDKWADIPNRYPKGSEVIIDGKEGKIYTDGILRMDDEVKGSQYFKASPGKSKVQIYHSNFSVPEPEVTAAIREAWL